MTTLPRMVTPADLQAVVLETLRKYEREAAALLPPFLSPLRFDGSRIVGSFTIQPVPWLLSRPTLRDSAVAAGDASPPPSGTSIPRA